MQVPAGDGDRRGSRRRELRVTAGTHLSFRTVACLASMTTCSLSWSAVMSWALTSRSWRHRWRWLGSWSRVGSHVASMRGPVCAIRSPGSVARRRVCRTPSWTAGAQRRCAVLPAGTPKPMPTPWMLGNTRPMADDSRLRGRARGLTDWRGERGVLDQLINTVRAGGSGVLVVRGEPGVGKSALLDYLVGYAAGCRVVRAAGVQSEMELAFAGLHQLLAPVVDRADRLPVPQRDALRTAFGLSAGPGPGRFLVGLGVLGLVFDGAGGRPLVCVVDDEQWLDRASVQALGFVARRLAADPVGLVFAVRVVGGELAGLPELAVAGLRAEEARVVLGSVLAGPGEAARRGVGLARARGDPLAVLGVARG